MKILLGADTYPPNVNGASRFAARLAQGLAARGHEVHVVCPSVHGADETVTVDGVIEHRIRSYRYPLHEFIRICMPWQAMPAVDRLVRELRPDVVHSQSHMLIGRAVLRSARRNGVPSIATNHFMPENVFGYLPLPKAFHPPVARWCWNDLGRVFGQSDMVTAPTPLAVELMESNTDIRGARAISCGIDTDKYWQATQESAAPLTPTILFVGRLDAEKHVDQLIKAVARFPLDQPVRLEIAGKGDRRASLEALAGRLGLGDRVSFLGFVDDDELLRAYGRASVFCMPGVSELQSIVTLEAMSAGKPVVAADAVALPHLVHPGENGWLFTPGNVDELSERLHSLIADPTLRRRMGAASRRIVERHGIAATLDSFEDLYRQVQPSPQETSTVVPMQRLRRLFRRAA